MRYQSTLLLPTAIMSDSRRRSVRPWHKDEYQNALKLSNSSKPLVPEELLDVASQRLVVMSLFVLLQGYKFYELLFPKSTYSAEMFAFKYLFFEGLFIWILPVFRIPWLCYSTFPNILFTIFVFLCNVGLSNNGISLMALIGPLFKAFFSREYTLSGNRASAKDLEYSKAVSGQYTIEILPESTAVLNPLGETFCIGDKFSSSVHLPLMFNSTEPALVRLNYIDLDTNDQSHIDFVGRDISKLPISLTPDGTEDVRFASVKITHPGVYRLAKVSDKDGVESRISGPDVIISQCPSARFEKKSNSDMCISQMDCTKIVVSGVPPLKLKYTRLVHGKESVHSIESVQPEDLVSPLIQGGVPRYIDGNDSLAWAIPQEVAVTIDASLGLVGEWIYNIDQLIDGFGNTVAYDELYEKRGKLYSSKAPEGLSSQFIVHSRPKIRFSGCSSETPLIMPKGQSLNLPLDLKGDVNNGPYVVEFQSRDMDGPGEQKRFSQTFSDESAKFSIKDPGLYSLVSLNGKYCSGDVSEPSSCLVYVPPEPEVNVDFVPIEDKCAGAIGVQADLTFAGTPPFKISYRVIKDGDAIEEKIISLNEVRHQLEFKPGSAGVYSYEFFDLKDSIYQSKDYCSRTFSTQLEIRALASAEFVGPLNRKCCSGDEVSFDVALSGLPPFRLAYEIVGNSRRIPVTIEDIQEYTYHIEVPPFGNGGKYSISLVSLEDNRGCRTLLKNEATIDVRRQRPSAGFLSIDGQRSIKALENSNVRMPLKLTGEGPWKVEYIYRDSEDRTDRYSMTLESGNDFIYGSKAGVYSISKVSDAYCPGEVGDSADFTVQWHEKPSISLETDENIELQPVCENSEDHFKLKIAGYPPFGLVYDVNGPVKLRDQKLTVATKFANVKTVTNKPGLYVYSFKQLSDAFYTLQGNDFSPVIVKQQVNSLPSATFISKGTRIRACSQLRDDDTVDDSIPIRFKGKAPFSVTLSIQHEGSGRVTKKTISNINSDHVSVTDVFMDLNLGGHIIRFDSVSDANGCSRHEFPRDEFIHITASEIPQAVVNELKTDYCVGERIMLPLTGSGPFEVKYEFNGKLQKAKCDTPFSRIASIPGTLILKSLADSASSCVLSLEESVKLITIHGKPTVKIDESLSRQVIREGDEASLVFAFTGTSPFSFTYTRSEKAGKSGRKKIAETHSVSNIQGYHYTIKTHTQGMYEAISVEDAYCSAYAIQK